MEIPQFIHYKQVGPQRRFQKILQTLTQSNSSNSLHESHSSKQRLNIHEELIRNQIEQTKEDCNKFYLAHPFPKDSTHNQIVHRNVVLENSNQKNQDLMKALQQQKGIQANSELKRQNEEQQDIQSSILSSSKQLITNQSISSLPMITELNQDGNLKTQENVSYYDPGINLKESSQILQKSQITNYQKNRNIQKGSGATLHEIVNKQLQAIRQSRKSLNKDLSFNSINQNSPCQIDDQSSNLYFASNTDIYSSSSNIFVNQDMCQQDLSALNIQALQIRMKEDKIPYYLQNQLPQLNVQNQLNSINSYHPVKYNHTKQSQMQKQLKSNNQQVTNILDLHRAKRESSNSPVNYLSTQKVYKKRNQSLNHDNQNQNSISYIKNEQTPLFSQVSNQLLLNQINQSQILNKSKAKKDFSLDSKIQSYNVEEVIPISNPKYQPNKQPAQKITVVRKLNITQTTIHQIQKAECQWSHKNTLEKETDSNQEDENTKKFLTERSKESLKQESPIKKILVKDDSKEWYLNQSHAQENLESQNPMHNNNSISERANKVKILQNQGNHTQQKSPSNIQNGYSTVDESKNYKIIYSNKKKNSLNYNTPSKVEKNSKSIVSSDYENESENSLNSPSLPPILVCTQQEIIKKLYKAKPKRKTIPQQEEQEGSDLSQQKISKRSSQVRNSLKKQISRQSYTNSGQTNQNFDNSLVSHTNIQLNQQVISQQQYVNLPQIQNMQTNPTIQQNKYMPEIKEEFSQSSRQNYTDGRVSSTYTKMDNNNSISITNASRQLKNFTPEEVQKSKRSSIEFKQLMQDLIKVICEFEIISLDETDPVLESYLYNMFAQKNQLQNQLQLLNTNELLISNTQALINTVKILIKQQHFIQSYPFHQAKFDQIIQKCEKNINKSCIN
ncbi:hypothetical protein ABPG72_001317 [Tetrahymena utriculariae]